jgi:Lon protease-like protein
MSDELQNFEGIARLFPLPNMVLFPFVIQPLHIFEERYRQMTADALASDRLICMALLRPGWEAEYSGRPPIHSVACLGRIVADQRLDDGRYNLLLRGLARVRIVEEIIDDKKYRSARLERLTDVPAQPPHVQQHLRRALAREAPRWMSGHPEMDQQFRRLLDSELPLGALCDIFSFALPLDSEFKQQLLEETDVERRTRCLLEYLTTQAPPTPKPDTDRPFPPGFSAN